MIKLIMKFITVQVICCALLIVQSFALTPQEAAAEAQRQANLTTIKATDAVNANTGVSKDALTSGDVHRVTNEQINMAAANVPTAQKVSAETQRLLDAAKADLADKKAVLADAQSGVSRTKIKEKEAALAEAQKLCPDFSGVDSEGFDGSCLSAESRSAIIRAKAELADAKVPNYNYAEINAAQAAVKAAEQAVIMAGHEAQYGAQTAAGAEAIRKAAKEIDDSITDEFAKAGDGSTKAGGIMDLIKKSTSATTLEKQYKNLGDYNAQLQQDIVMLILGQVTSRLNVCTQVPDIQLGIGAGQAFIMGEVAEYAQAEYLKGKLEKAVADRQFNPLDKQLDVFRTLRTEYQQVLASANTKQKFRNLSLTAYNNASALAAAEAVEDESWAVACNNSNVNMVSRGSNEGGDNIMMYLAMAAAAYAIPYCGGCAAAAIYMMLKGKSDQDKNSCESGGKATEQKIIDRKLACDQLGTEDMIAPPLDPVITASKTIRDRCLANGDAVSGAAGKGCQGYSGSGAGPYTPCDKASEAYKRNMAACPVSVLKAAKVSTLETSGVASAEGREFVRAASEKVSRTVDLRMASPRHRIIVWHAFAELANGSVLTNQEMIKVIQAQLDKIQKILDALEKYKDGVKLANNTKPNDVSIKRPAITAIEVKNLTLSNPTACLTGADGDCKSATEAFRSSNGFDNLSADLQTSTSKVVAGMDVFNNTRKLSSADIAKVANASQELNSISRILKGKQKQLKILLSGSKSAIDVNKESGFLVKDMKAAISKGNNGSGSGPQLSNALAGFGSGKGSSSGTDSADGSKDGIKDGENADKSGAAGSAFGAGGYLSGGALGSNNGRYGSSNSSGSSSAVDDKNDGANGAAGNGTTSEEDRKRLADAIEARNRTGEDKYVSKETQSIFEKITNAYIRNYDKFLAKKKGL